MQTSCETSRLRAWPDGVGRSEWNLVPENVRAGILRAIDESRWPIYLTGGVGTGKSCAAACVYQRWRASARWHRASEIVGDMLTCRTNGKGFVVRTNGENEWCEWERNIREKIAAASLVVFDDVGLREPSPAAYEAFYLLVESRKDRPTVYTSNLDGGQLRDAFDDRIASRILCGTRIRIQGPDRRLVRGETARG